MLKAAGCIAFTNPKGGTGKTTSCLSVAGYLARSGSKVLVVDFDPQANATSGLGIDRMTLQRSIYDAVLNYCNGYKGVPITQVILETDVENLHIAPSELDLGVAEVLMQRTGNRATILSRTLEEISTLYEYILIDLPPSSGLLTINGLYAANQVVVPLDASIYSLEALDNLKISFNDIKRINGHSINQITAILIRYVKPDLFSRVSRKRNPSQEVEARLREMFGTVFIVPDSVEIYETQRQGMPISHYATGSKTGRAYANIAKSLSINNNH
ncbi:ParA family protein, partial [Chloroflexota bacterium]